LGDCFPIPGFSKSSIFHPQISFSNQFVRNAGIQLSDSSSIADIKSRISQIVTQ
jgi:hypothetical protein